MGLQKVRILSDSRLSYVWYCAALVAAMAYEVPVMGAMLHSALFWMLLAAVAPSSCTMGTLLTRTPETVSTVATVLAPNWLSSALAPWMVRMPGNLLCEAEVILLAS